MVRRYPRRGLGDYRPSRCGRVGAHLRRVLAPAHGICGGRHLRSVRRGLRICLPRGEVEAG
jgi:hypothetical protein